MRAFIRGLAALLLVLVTACATGAPQTGEPTYRRDASLITREEIIQSHVSDAYEAVRVLRPAWLRKRGAMSVMQSSDVMVYVDNMPLGGPQSLRGVPITSVTRMQFLDAASATQRWGTNHVHGAILVSSM